MAKARFAMSALVKGPKARVAFPLEAKAWDVQVMRRGDKLAAEVVREHGGRDWRSLQNWRSLQAKTMVARRKGGKRRG